MLEVGKFDKQFFFDFHSMKENLSELINPLFEKISWPCLKIGEKPLTGGKFRIFQDNSKEKILIFRKYGNSIGRLVRILWAQIYLYNVQYVASNKVLVKTI